MNGWSRRRTKARAVPKLSAKRRNSELETPSTVTAIAFFQSPAQRVCARTTPNRDDQKLNEIVLFRRRIERT
jgi:hypothetical protein